MAYKLVPVSGRVIYDIKSARATATNAVSKSKFEQNRDTIICRRLWLQLIKREITQTATIKFNIPQSTLHDEVMQRKSKISSRCGPLLSYLTMH